MVLLLLLLLPLPSPLLPPQPPQPPRFSDSLSCLLSLASYFPPNPLHLCVPSAGLSTQVRASEGLGSVPAASLVDTQGSLLHQGGEADHGANRQVFSLNLGNLHLLLAPPLLLRLPLHLLCHILPPLLLLLPVHPPSPRFLRCPSFPFPGPIARGNLEP